MRVSDNGVVTFCSADQPSCVGVKPVGEEFHITSTERPDDGVIKFNEESYLRFLATVKGRGIGAFGEQLSGMYKLQLGGTTLLYTLDEVTDFVTAVNAGKCEPKMIRDLVAA